MILYENEKMIQRWGKFMERHEERPACHPQSRLSFRGSLAGFRSSPVFVVHVPGAVVSTGYWYLFLQCCFRPLHVFVCWGEDNSCSCYVSDHYHLRIE